MAGKNQGLSGGLPGVDLMIDGIQWGRYYLIGAESGVGKTTFADFYFVLCAWLEARRLGKPLRIFYISLELPERDKRARWCSFYIGWKYGLNYPSNFIMGKMEVLPNEEDLKLIKEANAFIDLMLKDVVLITSHAHPTAVFSTLVEHYERYGTVYRRPQSDEDRKKGRKGIITGYDAKPNLPMTMLVIDHLAYLDSESGLSLKGTMDRMSNQIVTLRNVFKLTAVVIQQFNTEMLASRRDAVMRRGAKDAGPLIEPQRIDFGDSKYTYRDADLVFGLINPADYSQAEYGGWKCESGAELIGESLGRYYVVLFLMKNRWGPSGRQARLFINPVTGVFYDLPLGFDQEQTWYTYSRKLTAENG